MRGTERLSNFRPIFGDAYVYTFRRCEMMGFTVLAWERVTERVGHEYWLFGGDGVATHVWLDC